jgi:hypothetical protein
MLILTFAFGLACLNIFSKEEQKSRHDDKRCADWQKLQIGVSRHDDPSHIDPKIFYVTKML